MYRLLAALLATAIVVPASAQVATTITAQTVTFSNPVQGISAPVTSNAVLRVGTEVPLRLAEELTTKGKKLKAGQRVHMEVAEAVIVQGVTVIPVGSPAIGELTDVRNKGMWGRSGHISARALYVTVNGRQIRLSGVFDDKGVAGGVGAVAVSAVVFLPAGFFMTGTSAKLPIGTPVKAFVDEDVPLSFASATMAPLAVTTSVLPIAVPAPKVVPAVSTALAPPPPAESSLKK